MLNIKHPKFAFAIDCKEASFAEYSALSAVIAEIAKTTPGFVVEGIGNVRRPDKQETKLEASNLFGFLAVKQSVKKVQPDVLYVGVDEKYDVSYGYRKDIATAEFPQLGVYTHNIPVYKLGVHTNKILKALADYVVRVTVKAAATPVEVARPRRVEFTGTYVRVDGQIMTHSMYKALYGDSEYKKPEPKCNCQGCQMREAIALLEAIMA